MCTTVCLKLVILVDKVLNMDIFLWTTIFKGKVSTQHKNKIEEKETERIKMLEPDLTKNNCSIIIKDIKAEDGKIYAFRVEGQNKHKVTYTPTVKVIIQGNACLCLVKFKRSRLFL